MNKIIIVLLVMFFSACSSGLGEEDTTVENNIDRLGNLEVNSKAKQKKLYVRPLASARWKLRFSVASGYLGRYNYITIAFNSRRESDGHYVNISHVVRKREKNKRVWHHAVPEIPQYLKNLGYKTINYISAVAYMETKSGKVKAYAKKTIKRW